MKVKTNELIGAALDWAVAKCMNLQSMHHYTFQKGHHVVPHPYYEGYDFGFFPSTDWAQGGPIIDRIQGLEQKQWLESSSETKCEVHIHNYDGDWIAFGPTLLITSMRCYVASKLGDKVEIPKELLQCE